VNTAFSKASAGTRHEKAPRRPLETSRGGPRRRAIGGRVTIQRNYTPTIIIEPRRIIMERKTATRYHINLQRFARHDVSGDTARVPVHDYNAHYARGSVIARPLLIYRCCTLRISFCCPGRTRRPCIRVYRPSRKRSSSSSSSYPSRRRGPVDGSRAVNPIRAATAADDRSPI